MVRTIITPTDSKISLAIPEVFVGKKIEVLMFEVEEVNPGATAGNTKLKPSELRGFLSHETAEAMQQHVQQSRNGWNTL